jgi:hypothetical protein
MSLVGIKVQPRCNDAALGGLKMNYAEQINAMGKLELRAAMKAAGMSYSKLNVQGMRDALLARLAQEDAFTSTERTEIAQEVVETEAHAAPVEYTQANVREHNCPGCGIGLDNGVLHCTDLAMVPTHPGSAFATEGSKSYHELGQMDHEFECMGCGHQFGAKLEPWVAPTPSEGLKIEKNRPVQNGITRPSAGGKCRAVWDQLDELRASLGTVPSSKDVKVLAQQNGWNPNNASIEFYQWRKYNGIFGRAPKA